MRKPGENRGGARPGAGRGIARHLSDKLRGDFEKEMRRKAKETGIPFAQLCVDQAWQDPEGEDVSVRAVLQARKMCFDSQLVRESHSEREVKKYEPLILPELKTDPATVEGDGEQRH